MAAIESPLKERVIPERLLELRGVLDDLVRAKIVSQRDAEDILIAPRTAKQMHMHPLEIIAERELDDPRRPAKKLDLDELTHWLCDMAHQPYYRIDPLKVNVNKTTEVMSYAFAQRHNILAVEVREEEIVIASAQPFMAAWEGMLVQTLRGRRIVRVVANPQELTRYMLEFYTMARSVAKASDAGLEVSNVTNFEQMLELGQLKSPDANDAHIVNIVDWLLQYAFDQRASDIHIEPRRDKGHVRFRIDGVMHHVYELPPAVNAAVTSRLKILGRMDVAEKRRPQDGRVKTKSPDGQEIELRLSTLPTAFGEKMVARIFDPDVLLRNFQELGLGGDDNQRWQAMVNASNGIVLVTGPTGSGKTTTLYSTLKQLATPQVNVCTIEDPIEMVSPEFNQMQVQAGIDLDFASGVRTLLRQDPDIIMIGEVRDLETAQMAVQASLTGHLVLSTLHTNDAPSAVTRLLDLGVPHYLIQSTLTGVVAQRLVRTLCPHCKAESPVDVSAWDALVHRWRIPPPPRVFAAVGCLECRNTGFLGRTGIYEMMRISSSLRQMIQPAADLSRMSAAALSDGMRPLHLSAAMQVARGVTTIAEVVGVLPPLDA